GNYKMAIGERLDRNTVIVGNFGDADYHKIVYAFYVDGKEYRCTGGNYQSFIYYLFSKPKVKILYNVDDPRQSFEKTSSWIVSYTFLFIIFVFLYLLMQVV
ncbi:MAG: hypothetical protein K2H20_02200, partial [Bacilli bacterium]|nr:hypothetical protein [Bacilli bacterium]